jgi:lysophospholipid acyltransferase (LPLAT)-like uncharacterized protein
MPHPIDAVAEELRPLVRGLAGVGATGLHAYLRTLRATCRLELEGREVLARLPRYVLCFWHTFTVPGFLTIMATQEGRPMAALCHPALHLLMWETLGRRLGWQVVMGSSGHGGKEAAERIIESLREGYSTFVCPDGPSGPARHVKRGALYIASKASAPIVPLAIECDRALWLPRWDRFCLPLPSAIVRVRCGEPVHVAHDALPEAEALLAEALG